MELYPVLYLVTQSHQIIRLVKFNKLKKLTIASIISPSFSSVMCRLIALNNKLYFVSLCIGRTKISANLNLDGKKMSIYNGKIKQKDQFHTPITQFLPFTPSQISLKKSIISVQIFTVKLTCTLFSTILFIRRKCRCKC